MRWTIPNILTCLRLVMALCVPLVFFALDRPDADIVALILFLVAAFTDFLDGWLARRMSQISGFGAMLDPIADKVIIVSALFALIALNGVSWVILPPALVIIFREIAVSGLREYLGGVSLAVTRLAKWKTTVQMVAIAGLFLAGIWEVRVLDLYHAMDPNLTDMILAGDVEDTVGLGALYEQSYILTLASALLIWVAALLTLVTGWDYLRKALPYLEVPR